MNRSRTVVADCETPLAAPVVNACDPLVVIVPPPWVIWPAPAITPRAIEVPKISKVVVVHLIFQGLLANLIETVKLVEVY